MNFHRSSNSVRTYRSGVFAAVLFFAGLILAHSVAPNFFSGIAARTAFPLLSARAILRALWNSGAEPTTTADPLRAERAFLQARIQSGASGNTDVLTQNGFIVPVLARPRWSAYDTLLLGMGKTQGIMIGMRIQAHGFFIGEITEVYPESSLAALYSAPGREVAAQLAGSVPVVLVGAGGGVFETSVAEDTPVRAGDGAFASNLSPRLFAVVDAVVAGSDGAWKVYLRLPLNLFELRSVAVEAF